MLNRRRTLVYMGVPRFECPMKILTSNLNIDLSKKTNGKIMQNIRRYSIIGEILIC